jgi:hypothetical protein
MVATKAEKRPTITMRMGERDARFSSCPVKPRARRAARGRLPGAGEICGFRSGVNLL